MNEPKPSNFPIGSTESRAAARLMLERSLSHSRQLIFTWGRAKEPIAFEWEEGSDGRQCRTVILPFDFPLVSGLKLVGGFTAADLKIIADRYGAESVEHPMVFALESQ